MLDRPLLGLALALFSRVRGHGARRPGSVDAPGRCHRSISAQRVGDRQPAFAALGFAPAARRRWPVARRLPDGGYRASSAVFLANGPGPGSAGAGVRGSGVARGGAFLSLILRPTFICFSASSSGQRVGLPAVPAEARAWRASAFSSTGWFGLCGRLGLGFGLGWRLCLLRRARFNLDFRRRFGFGRRFLRLRFASAVSRSAATCAWRLPAPAGALRVPRRSGC